MIETVAALAAVTITEAVTGAKTIVATAANDKLHYLTIRRD